MKYRLVVLLCLFVISGSAQTPTTHTADEQAIGKLNEQALKAYNLGDSSTLDKIEDSDFLLTGDFGEITKTQHLDAVRNRKQNQISVPLTISNARFRFYGDTALLTEIEKYGNPPEEPGFETTSLWVRRGGEWKLVHMHYSRLTQKP